MGPDDAPYGRHPQPAPGELGGEEGIEDLAPRLLVHPAARVRDLEVDVGALGPLVEHQALGIPGEVEVEHHQQLGRRHLPFRVEEGVREDVEEESARSRRKVERVEVGPRGHVVAAVVGAPSVERQHLERARLVDLEQIREAEARIEGLFQRARQDRSMALELKSELDRQGLFKRYEDRFLDLFKNAE